MISANGGLPAHRYTAEVTPRWPRGSEPASAIQGPLQGFCCIQGFVGASEQFRAEVYHALDGVSKEKEYFLGCQGRVGPPGGCSSTVMDRPSHFCLFLCFGDG